ncbi:MAG: histidine kinase [Gammaproteobacteria bacterium]|nr:histidine kinase [Gammaproteobacteria bacterium]
MSNQAQKDPPVLKIDSYLPDFCDAAVFLRVLLVIELFAIVFALVSYSSGSLYVQIALNSVLMQWISLSVAAILCGITRLGYLRDTRITTVVTIGLTLIVTLLVSWLSANFAEMLRIDSQSLSLGFVLLRNSAIAMILIGLALRYFYVQYESERTLEVQAQARLQALQARIRPHFLFNSMNTIASLTHDHPDLAEQAIENLSDLFRASLAAEASIPLQQELELTRSYIQLESLRLGDRLFVKWHMPYDDIEVSLPALTLQPLVENAIYHGVEPLAEGGVIDITIDRENEYTRIVISNPLLEDRTEQHREGNQMAVDNIRERLAIAFSGEAIMQQVEDDDRFTVTLKLPANAA